MWETAIPKLAALHGDFYRWIAWKFLMVKELDAVLPPEEIPKRARELPWVREYREDWAAA